MRPLPLKDELSANKQAVSIVLIFHAIGLVGLILPFTRYVFLQIVPFHLLLMLAVIVLKHKSIDSRFIFFLVSISVLGFAVEWVGTHTHLLFGDYSYGSTLGFKISDVPLIIGCNWFMLIYSTGVLMQRSRLKNFLIRSLIGALLLVLLDTLIESVAIHFNYWHWASSVIPLKNYICWFGVSFLMLLVFEAFKFKPQSIVAVVFLLTQFAFFGLLDLISS
ncbi:MAG: carotenoid biosynthesis protein [Bacteroidetes bacterium]|jgi:putative membrane protein|nr:carotenoid biosynthesis protein [Bacteroidota bacterium]